MKPILAIAAAGMVGALLVSGAFHGAAGDLLGDQRVTIDRQMELIAIQRQTIEKQRQTIEVAGLIADELEFLAAMLAADVLDCEAGLAGWEL